MQTGKRPSTWGQGLCGRRSCAHTTDSRGVRLWAREDGVGPPGGGWRGTRGWGGDDSGGVGVLCGASEKRLNTISGGTDLTGDSS